MPPVSSSPAYLLLGDEVFFRDRFREQILAAIPPENREFAVLSADLRETSLDDILDQARTPSLLAGCQVFFIRNVKELFGRGNRAGGDFPANLERYLADPPPLATLVFSADHLVLPADPRQINFEDKSRLERIENTLGRLCEVVRCARVDASTAADLINGWAARRGWTIEPEATQLLVDLVDADLGLAASELSKLADYAGLNGPASPATPPAITADAVALLVAGQRQRSALDLARHLARRQRPAALLALAAIWEAEGDAAAIPLVSQLSRFFKMALLAREKRVRDRRQLYEALPPGLKPPGFAVDVVLALAQNRSSAYLMSGIERLQRIDVALRSSPLSPKWLLEELIVSDPEANAVLFSLNR